MSMAPRKAGGRDDDCSMMSHLLSGFMSFVRLSTFCAHSVTYGSTYSAHFRVESHRSKVRTSATALFPAPAASQHPKPR